MAILKEIDNLDIALSLKGDLQQEVYSMLKSYDRVTVVKNGNDIQVQTFLSLGTGDEIIAEYHKDDIYTKEEQIVNYVNTFKQYPAEYKGVYLYTNLREQLKTATAKMLQGTIVIS